MDARCEEDCLGEFVPVNHAPECKLRNITVIGSGCNGSLITYNLAKQFNVHVLEAGLYKMNDGATYNLAIPAPTAAQFTPFSLVTQQQPTFTEPSIATGQWTALTFDPRWNFIVRPPELKPAVPASPNVVANNISAGRVVGGSFEHIQGVYVNPSEARCRRWAEATCSDDYLPENLYPLLTKTEHFRAHTDSTNQTQDGTTFAPKDGPSLLGSDPVNRGYEGPLQVMQASPSTYSDSLAQATYNHYHDVKNYKEFSIQPGVKDCKSTTFNSGINACVTRSPERFIDQHRVRVSTARNYLNPSVIQPENPDEASGNPGYTINRGPFYGINGFNIKMDLDKLIQRIVFKTKKGYPHGFQYWIPSCEAKCVKADHFCQPLRAIGVVLGTEDNPKYIPMREVILTLGVIGTPALLMRSGVGPKGVLKNLGIPVLMHQPNMGRNIGNHYGAVMRWRGNAARWGATEAGTENANGYLPIAENPKWRKFQYFSAAQTGAQRSWSINLYDLTPKSTGFLEINTAWLTDNANPGVDFHPNYYAGPAGQVDIDNLCEVVRDMSAAVFARDPTAVFLNPPLPYPFNITNSVLFKLLIETPGPPPATSGLVTQTHQVGSCGMGPNPETSCVDTDFKLRGTSNVYVCDASSTPLEEDSRGFTYPLQNDGNTTRGLIALAQVFSETYKSRH